MTKIKRLPLHEAQKIAAGEVVDRPANVVKELIENALDANATQITIYLEQAGKQQIRIVDNGCGMSPEDAHLCFEQHATSKIETVAELTNINTFGFRGEALASIAAVSSITLCTKQEQDIQGTKLTLKYGKLEREEITACPTGTDICVNQLFENLPARKKFLKTDDTEWRAIIHIVQAFGLDYLGVHFKLYHDGKQILNCHPTESLIQRTAQLWDHALTNAMLPIITTHVEQSVTISGAISNYQYSRYDRNHIFIFVNKRWIKNHQLVTALVKGYLNALPPGRYPVAALFIQIDPQQVDINIHPRKEEVQFLHPIKVATRVQETIKKTLEEQLSKHLKKPAKAPFELSNTLEFKHQSFPPLFHRSFTPFNFDTIAINDAQPLMEESTQEKSLPPTQETIGHNQQQSLSSILPLQSDPQLSFEKCRIIGQYHKTYILIEETNGLFLIDQHAAHERILYELFTKKFYEVATIKLLFPHILTLTPYETNIIEKNFELFRHHGIDLERLSENQIMIVTTPVHIKDKSIEDIIKQAIAWIIECASLDKDMFFKTIHEKMHAQMACKAAIKAGDELSSEKMEQLLQDLTTTANRFTCPHGRPTGWLLTLYDIEKKFKRKL